MAASSREITHRRELPETPMARGDRSASSTVATPADGANAPASAIRNSNTDGQSNKGAVFAGSASTVKPWVASGDESAPRTSGSSAAVNSPVPDAYRDVVGTYFNRAAD